MGWRAAQKASPADWALQAPPTSAMCWLQRGVLRGGLACAVQQLGTYGSTEAARQQACVESLACYKQKELLLVVC